jgi:hypothetical protein
MLMRMRRILFSTGAHGAIIQEIQSALKFSPFFLPLSP